MNRLRANIGTIALLFHLSTSAQDPLSIGLVAHYPLDGNANDTSGNGNNGIVHGATLASDQFGRSDSAYLFNGTDSYILAFADGLPKTNRTISLWFKLENGAVGGATVLGYGGNGSVGSSLYMSVKSGCNASSYVVGGHGAFGLGLTTPKAVPEAWTHYAGTISNGVVRIYINGKEVGNNSGGFPSTWTASRYLYIGTCVATSGLSPYADSCVNYFKGNIDEVRIYDRPLSSKEIALLYATEGHLQNSLSVKVKTVQVDMFVKPGQRYQLETTLDLIVWASSGDPFTASTSVETVDVDVSAGAQYFRLRSL
jgi:hypothetical protein